MVYLLSPLEYNILLVLNSANRSRKFPVRTKPPSGLEIPIALPHPVALITSLKAVERLHRLRDCRLDCALVQCRIEVSTVPVILSAQGKASCRAKPLLFHSNAISLEAA